MGIELYLVRPDATGRVIFPFWTRDGDDLPGIDARCIDSLKWATWHDPAQRLQAAGIGPRPDPIPPDQLVAGAGRGLRALLDELVPIHADFAALAAGAGNDPDAVRALLWQFASGEISVADDTARQRVKAHAAGTFEGFVDLYQRILTGGREGRFGCWSY